jgi:organic radical activating enzyme
MKKFNIDILQFYITNVCNLTCKDCESFNDRKFKGHFYWEDYADDYRQWSKLVDIENLGIIGGEPFANPTLLTWVKEVKALWPNSPTAEIWTNGTYLKHKQDLAKQIIKEGFQLRVCVHDPAQYDEVKFYLEEILKDFNPSTQQTLPNNIEYYTGNQKIATIFSTYSFYKVAQHHISRGITYLHNSDPDAAFKICGDECHYLLRGKMYRCALTAIASDLTEQFKIEDSAANLLKNYKSCSPWDSLTDIESFIDGLSSSVPQCSVCPEKRTLYPIWPLAGKKSDYE